MWAYSESKNDQIHALPIVCCQEWHLVVWSSPFEVQQDVKSGGWLTFSLYTGNPAANKVGACEKEEEKAVEVRVREKKQKGKKFTIEKIQNLPSQPVHTQFQGLYAQQIAQSIGPAVALGDPYALFLLFFSEK